jgi:anti-anti-sigma factor
LEANSTSAARFAPPERPSIDVTLDTGGYAAVVALRGEHDVATSEAVRVALRPLHGVVLVDLGDCEFIDSTIIETLLAYAQQLAAEGHHLELMLPPPRSVVARALELIKIRDAVYVRDSVDAPLGSATGPLARASSARG